MIQDHNYARARQELERTLLRSDKLGVKPLAARVRFLQATTARQSSQTSEAQDNYRGAIQLLEGMSKEQGAEKILQRSDFKTMYDEAKHGSQAAKS